MSRYEQLSMFTMNVEQVTATCCMDGCPARASPVEPWMAALIPAGEYVVQIAGHPLVLRPIHTLRDVENYIDTQPEATPQEVAGQCWRNSKYDPPTEADADRLGRIIVWGAAVKHVDITYWENAIFHPVDVPFWMPLPVAPEEKAE